MYMQESDPLSHQILLGSSTGLISRGTYKHPYIGIAGVDMTPEIAREMDMNDSRGFLVTEVTSGSPAERSGIRGGGDFERC